MSILRKNKQTRRDFSDPEEYRLTLSEHLDELRARVIRIVVYLLVGWVIGWVIEPVLYSFVNNLATKSIVPNLPKGIEYKEVFANATEPFLLKFRLSFLIGVVLTFPFLVYELWGFVAPGLKKNERKPFERLAPLSILLFIMGAGFCWLILPSAFSWFASFLKEFPGAELYQGAGSMVFFVIKMMAAFGIGFQLPLVVYGLGLAGLLSSETLIKNWRQAATLIFIAAAIITPSADAFSMVMMAIPLVILFMISVYCVKITQRKRDALKDSEEAEELPEDEQWGSA